MGVIDIKFLKVPLEVSDVRFYFTVAIKNFSRLVKREIFVLLFAKNDVFLLKSLKLRNFKPKCLQKTVS